MTREGCWRQERKGKVWERYNSQDEAVMTASPLVFVSCLRGVVYAKIFEGVD